MREKKILQMCMDSDYGLSGRSSSQSSFGALYISFRARPVKIMKFTEQITGFHWATSICQAVCWLVGIIYIYIYIWSGAYNCATLTDILESGCVQGECSEFFLGRRTRFQKWREVTWFGQAQGASEPCPQSQGSVEHLPAILCGWMERRGIPEMNL